MTDKVTPFPRLSVDDAQKIDAKMAQAFRELEPVILDLERAASSFWCLTAYAQHLRQLGDVGGDAPGPRRG
jgi:hypothetical protein